MLNAPLPQQGHLLSLTKNLAYSLLFNGLFVSVGIALWQGSDLSFLLRPLVMKRFLILVLLFFGALSAQQISGAWPGAKSPLPFRLRRFCPRTKSAPRV
jgi:hypothetical protein